MAKSSSNKTFPVSRGANPACPGGPCRKILVAIHLIIMSLSIGLWETDSNRRTQDPKTRGWTPSGAPGKLVRFFPTKNNNVVLICCRCAHATPNVYTPAFIRMITLRTCHVRNTVCGESVPLAFSSSVASSTAQLGLGGKLLNSLSVGMDLDSRLPSRNLTKTPPPPLRTAFSAGHP